MSYTSQFTVGQICGILGETLPERYQYLEDEVAANIAYKPQFMTEGGAYFLAGKDPEDRAKRLAKAIEEKVRIVFVGEASRDLPRLEEIPHVVLHTLPFRAVVTLSDTIRQKLGMEVIGITGSLGKTTTKDMIHAVLSQSHNARKSLGNQNTIYPIFDNLQKMPPDTEFYVQEFGAATPGVMPKTVRACLPDAAVITNISDPHLDVFGTRENILKEKMSLIKRMRAGCPAFLNYDDPLLRKVRLQRHPLITYAVENRDADYYADNLVTEAEYMTFDIVHRDRRIPVRLNAVGTHNVSNALVAAAVGEWFGISQEDIVNGIAAYESAGCRQNLVNIGGYHLFLDCYNTAPVSLLGAVDTMARLPLEPGGRRIAVLGDMARLGSQAEQLHTETGRKIAQTGILDLALCFGDENAAAMAAAMEAEGTPARYTADRDQLNRWMTREITKKDLTLVKGPVARLLSRSVDQVFGTAYHTFSEHFELVTRDGFRMRKIFEKEDHDRIMTAVMGYRGQETDLVIPGRCDGTDVFCVAKNAFLNNETVRRITISAPIACVAFSAFRGCANLQEVIFPDTLKTVRRAAFRDCVNLQSVRIPEGVTDVGMAAFYGCTDLKTVSIPGSVGRIGVNAFYDCPNVTLLCPEGSLAHAYAMENGIPFLTEPNSVNQQTSYGMPI